MPRVMDAGPLLLGRDLAVEIAGHALELGSHGFDLRDFPPFLLDLKFLQANEALTRFHRLTPPAGLTGFACRGARRARRPTDGKPTGTTLVFGFFGANRRIARSWAARRPSLNPTFTRFVKHCVPLSWAIAARPDWRTARIG